MTTSRDSERATPPNDAAPRPDESTRVLLTGAAGYIGSIATQRLLDAGHEVVALDSLMFGTGSLDALADHPRFRLVEGDIRDERLVRSLMQEVDAVAHLASIVGDPACAVDAETTQSINVTATRMLATTAREFGIERFIFASSCSVYGASDEIVDEHAPLNPVSIYAESKIEGETILRELSTDEFRPTILRFATLHGISPRPRLDLVVNLFAMQAITAGRIRIFGEDQWRPFLSVSDAGASVAHVLSRPLDRVAGEIFNIGSEAQNYRLGDLGDFVLEAVPGIEVIRMSEQEERRNYRVSFAKTREHLGFVPSGTLLQGVCDVRDAVREGVISDPEHPRHSNVRTLTETYVGAYPAKVVS